MAKRAVILSDRSGVEAIEVNRPYHEEDRGGTPEPTRDPLVQVVSAYALR